MFKPIPNFENYLISEDGVIVSKRGIVTPYLKRGYLRIRLNKESKRYDFGVHKLVAIAYLGEPEGGLEVNHIDANKTNNHVSNLEWLSHADNVRLARNKPITVMDEAGAITTYPSRTALGKALWGETSTMRDNLPKYIAKGKIPKFGLTIIET